ncbi:hypothetical protein [Roseinatronobacter monicus]|uniref:hypothetical protein n=1 Tax=Roseinatronobacter monicus TaxID=393481 RepID=UPI003F32C3F1
MELVTPRGPNCRGSLMPKVSQVYALERVAQMLGEDLEMLEAIVSNDDNLSYGNIISVDTATDENTKLITAHGIEELHDMLSDARRRYGQKLVTLD